MALAALIVACRQVEDGEDGLRATLPVAGRTLVEHQVRLATWAGARHIVVLVERVPAALAAAIDRLRRDGVRIELVRSVAEAAETVHPQEALLLFADGGIMGAGLARRLAAAQVPALLTVPAAAHGDAFERIDGDARWGGLALIDGARLHRTAAMLGEWDLASTLLRHAVQEGATRIEVFPNGRAGGGRDLLVTAAASETLHGLDARLRAEVRVEGTDWPQRHLFPLLDAVLAEPLMRSMVEPAWLAWGGVAAAALAVPAVAADLRWLALLLLLLSGPALFLADGLAAARLGLVRHASRLRQVRDVAALVTLGAFAHRLAAEAGWGAWVLAAGIPLGLAGLALMRQLRQRLVLAPPAYWHASVDGLVWGLLPAAIGGWWLAGLGAMAVYAIASMLVLQWQSLRALDAVSGNAV